MFQSLATEQTGELVNMKKILVCLFCFWGLPVFAKDVTVTLNDEEQRVIIQLLDMATKAGGLQVAKAATHFADKITAAAQAELKPAAPK